MDPSVAPSRVDPEQSSSTFWLTPAAYWVPPHLPVSAWHTHGPFAAWLVDVMRPQTIVELGSHFGYSCFAFAEAAKRLGLPTTVNALDTWQGDDHAGHYGEDVYEFVSSVARDDYPEIVRLMRGWFSQSRPLFADSSIDLLHIDGRHAYEDVVADYTEWRSGVREGGVILFHDIAERDNGFGVWRLWEEIAEPGRSFAFEHGHGLGILAVGDIVHAPLRALFASDAATAARIRADFARLGEVIERQVWLESLPGELQAARADAHRRDIHEANLEAALGRQNKRIDDLTSSTSWRVTSPLRALGRLRPRRRTAAPATIDSSA